MGKKTDSRWYGMLEAGVKSSAVVRDVTLDTGNPATIYLFNHSRGAFVEYYLNIVEHKLRDLGPDEKGMVKQLRKAFDTARTSFTPRRLLRPTLPRPKQVELEEEPDADDVDVDLGDDDNPLDLELGDESEEPEDDDED